MSGAYSGSVEDVVEGSASEIIVGSKEEVPEQSYEGLSGRLKGWLRRYANIEKKQERCRQIADAYWDKIDRARMLASYFFSNNTVGGGMQVNDANGVFTDIFAKWMVLSELEDRYERAQEWYEQELPDSRLLYIFPISDLERVLKELPPHHHETPFSKSARKALKKQFNWTVEAFEKEVLAELESKDKGGGD